MQELVQVIQSIGFPTVFCFLMWKYISEQSKQVQDVITEFTATMSKFQVTMTENNRLIQVICDKLDVNEE